MDDDAQFLALGDIYDRLTEQQQEERRERGATACTASSRLIGVGQSSVCP